MKQRVHKEGAWPSEYRQQDGVVVQFYPRFNPRIPSQLSALNPKDGLMIYGPSRVLGPLDPSPQALKEMAASEWMEIDDDGLFIGSVEHTPGATAYLRLPSWPDDENRITLSCAIE